MPNEIPWLSAKRTVPAVAVWVPAATMFSLEATTVALTVAPDAFVLSPQATLPPLAKFSLEALTLDTELVTFSSPELTTAGTV